MALRQDREVTVGRSKKSTFFVTDQHVSGIHLGIVFRQDRWYLRDCKSTNGTFINGTRIQGEVELQHGQVVKIGETKLQFMMHEDDASSVSTQVAASGSPQPFAHAGGDSSHLTAAEMLSVFRFMVQGLDATLPQDMIRAALETIQSQMKVTAVGFLSFDAEAPVTRLIIPEGFGLDAGFSRGLTERVQSSGGTVWLDERRSPEQMSDSLASYTDAICAPLGTQDSPQGAIHVYARDNRFTKRDVRFVEAVADCLNRSLKQVHRQRRLRAENQRLRSGPLPEEKMLGDSPPMQFLRDRIERLAPTRRRTILIIGESGVGKELVAAEIHRQSLRSDKPFVPVNCAALPPALAGAHLFGHERGAFTNADAASAGYFREADDGTLFLDEVAELPIEIQATLLRAIEGRGFRSVGGQKDIHVDVRVIAATNKNLAELTRDGKFRDDLFRRFEVSILAPPLRERGDDIELLACHFAKKIAGELDRQVKLSESALARLRAFPWPGNVRQLQSALSEAITFNDKDIIEAEDLDLAVDPGEEETRPRSLKLADVEAWAIRKAVRQSADQDLMQIAKMLGISRDTLRTKMAKYSIRRD
jgi:Nif-specific regulatory protein